MLYLKRFLARFAAVSFLALLSGLTVACQDVGQHVRLKAFSDLGVPLHAEQGQSAVSDRLPGGSVAEVVQKGPNDWFKISGGGKTGWIIKKYIDEVVPAPAPVQVTFDIGCWNLEHFHDGMTRGFPEYTYSPPGPSYPPRTQEDFVTIASMIEAVGAKILVLEEIYAEEMTVDGETEFHSKEVERLIAVLGSSNYAYIIGRSGGTQHVAMLYDKRVARLNASLECDFPSLKIENKTVFDRQPLIAHFTFLQNGQPMNDLAIVGVHLAAGQDLAKNHDKAFELLQQKITDLRAAGLCIPKDENDIFIAGDFNCNRFDSKIEVFWNAMEAGGWDVLADNKDTYPVTRLSGVPLGPGTSTIDYIIITKGIHGLQGEEINVAEATVHVELIKQSDPKPYEAFRRAASDHLPVTVAIKVMNDTDGP